MDTSLSDISFLAKCPFLLNHIKDIPGESEDNVHRETGWCEISSLEQDFASEASPLAPGKREGRGAVKCDHSVIKITKLVDRASTKLMEACWEGRTLDEVIIECYRAGEGQGGGNKPINYFSIELKKVVIRELEYEVTAGDLASEDLELVYNSATYKYYQMKKDDGTALRIGAESRNVGSGNWKD